MYIPSLLYFLQIQVNAEHQAEFSVHYQCVLIIYLFYALYQ